MKSRDKPHHQLTPLASAQSFEEGGLRKLRPNLAEVQTSQGDAMQGIPMPPYEWPYGRI